MQKLYFANFEYLWTFCCLYIIVQTDQMHMTLSQLALLAGMTERQWQIT